MVVFSLEPERYSVTSMRRVLSSPPEGGFVDRRQINTAVSADSGQAEMRTFTLEWEYASQADAATVKGYQDDTFGGAIPLEWTPPQAGSAIDCRIVTVQIQSVTPTGGVRIVVVLEEVL